MSDKDPMLTKFDELRPAFDDYMRQLEHNRRYYNLDFDTDVIPRAAIDAGFKPVLPPTAQQAIDEAADHILYFPKIKIPVRPTESESLTEQDIAERKRRFLLTWWRQVTQRYNPLGDGRKILLNEGKLVLKMGINPELLPDADADDSTYREQLRKINRYDFMWQVDILDNATVYEDPSNHRDPQYVYVQYDIYVEEAKRRYPDATGEWRDRRDYDTARFLELWTKPQWQSDGSYTPGEFRQWVDTDSVYVGENPYPYLPIAIEDAGYGTVRQLAKVEQKYRGLTEGTHSIFIAEARQMSAMEAVAELTAFSPVITRNMSETKQIKMGPGEVINLEGGEGEPEAETIEFAKWPDIPQTVLQMLAKTTQIANSTLKIGLLGGIPQTGVDTATEADMNVRNASSKLAAPIAALERLVTKINRWVLMDIEHTIGASVTLYGSEESASAVGLGPRDIAGYYDSYVTLSTTDEDNIAMTKARLWAELYQNVPYLSAETAMERGGIADDPLRELIKRASEDVYNSPALRQIRDAVGAAQFAQLQQAMQVAGQTAPGPAQASGVPGANDANSLVSQQSIISPVQANVRDQSMVMRDIQQGGSQFRGG